jgi:hypothetical protein
MWQPYPRVKDQICRDAGMEQAEVKWNVEYCQVSGAKQKQ